MLLFPKLGKRAKRPRKPIASKARFRSYGDPKKTYRGGRSEAEIRRYASACLAERLANRTDAEVEFEHILLGLGVPFEREKVFFIADPAGRIRNFLIGDFYCQQARTVFEADGSSHRGRGKYDLGRDQYLASKGIRTMRFTNREILGKPEDVARRIRAALNV